MKTDLLVYVFFCMYIFMFHVVTNWYFDAHLTSSLTLADLPFLYQHFISEYAIFDFCNVDF